MDERASRFRQSALAFTVMFVALAAAASAGSSTQARELVPDRVLAAARNEIEVRVGARFCTLYVRYLPDSSAVASGEEDSVIYRLRFALEVPELEISEPIIGVSLTEDAALATGSAVHGLPDCVAAPGECRMLIGRPVARLLAAEYWRRIPSDDWDVRFTWSHADGYLWVVRTEFEQTTTTSWTRCTVEIDVNTGEIVRDLWTVKTVNRC